MIRIILVASLTLHGSLDGSPWDKVPAKWNLVDVSRILQDFPWSPAGVNLERQHTSRHTDPQTGMVTMRQISRSKPQPKVPVIWWSSKTIRLAQQRLRQLSNPAQTAEPFRAEELPDYVLVIEGSEPLRILQGAKEDLGDTVFLELANGMMLDLESVRCFDGNEQEEPRVEFSFPKANRGPSDARSGVGQDRLPLQSLSKSA